MSHYFANSILFKIFYELFHLQLKLKQRKAALHPSVYEVLKTGLNDEYECVREVALQAIVALSEEFPDQ